MAQVHVLKSDTAKLDLDRLGASTRKMVRAQVNADGTFAGKPRRWYIQKLGVGQYRIMHNLTKSNYAVSVGQVDNERLSITTSNLSEVSFDVTTKKDNEFVDAPFVFALNVQG